MNNDWNTKNQEVKNNKVMRATIAIVLSFIGISILMSQIFPVASSYIQGKMYEFKASLLVKPMPDAHKEYVSGQFAYYNPGQSYFQNLLRIAGEDSQSEALTYDPSTKQLKPVVIDKAYNKDMALSISSLGINGINITSNVESYDDKVYNLQLKRGLAHFKGTPLPGDGGNSFVYGHSAVPNFFTSHQNLPETIFSKLEKVELGTEVHITRDGKVLKYIVRTKKIIDPNDFSVLQSNGDKETVTLMTCWPIGVPEKRLIVVAERYE
jgi:LPXTG-site transpeptidase (sortase) family protein